MSTSNFINGQNVVIVAPHNHLQISDTVYQIGAISRIAGLNSIQLLKDNTCIGAIPESKLKAIR